MGQETSVVPYDPKFKVAFRTLNLQWIETYFRVEKKDLQQVMNPENCLSDHGEIFFIVHEEEAIGTCALYKIGPKRYELAKMAVRPDFQGKGFGDLLMKSAEKWARDQGADEILILSNTILVSAINLYRKHGYRTSHLGPHPDYERCNIEMKKSFQSQHE